MANQENIPDPEVIILGLREEIRQREERRQKLDEEIWDFAKVVRYLEASSEPPAVAPRRRAGSHGAELTDAIERTLLAERPLHRKTILEKVTAAGLYIGGTNPLAVLGSYLSLDKRFKNVGRGMWTLSEKRGNTLMLGVAVNSEENLRID